VAVDRAWLAKHKQNIHDNSLNDKKRERDYKKVMGNNNKSYRRYNKQMNRLKTEFGFVNISTIKYTIRQ